MPAGAELLGFLASPAWGDLLARHGAEVFGFVTGVACVALLVRQSIWNWPVGIANNLTFIVLYNRHGLYADVGLQGFYVVISLYGWWAWLHGGRNHGRLAVSRVKPAVALMLAAGVAAATLVMATALKRFTNSSVPYLDSLITALSLAAQFMMTRKWIENWAVWIAANCVSVGLLIFKGLYVTASLYLVYQVLCVLGWRQWRQALQEA